MKRAALTLGLTLLATPAAAQWLGEPMWNDPTAGTGFTIYGDYSRPNSNAGGGTAFGGRVALGAGIFTLTGGVSSGTPTSSPSACSPSAGRPRSGLSAAASSPSPSTCRPAAVPAS